MYLSVENGSHISTFGWLKFSIMDPVCCEGMFLSYVVRNKVIENVVRDSAGTEKWWFVSFPTGPMTSLVLASQLGFQDQE